MNKFWGDLVYKKIVLVVILVMLPSMSILLWEVEFMPKITFDNSCRYLNLQQRFDCYKDEALQIQKNKGISEALSYTQDVIGANSNHNLVHLIFHKLGEEYYGQSNDLGISLAVAKKFRPTKHTDDHLDGIEGFTHGVLRAYFAQRSNEPIQQLIESACSTYSDIYKDDEMPEANLLISDECYHGVGHALMLRLGNDVKASVNECKKIQNEKLKDSCEKGVFMENGYLFISFYEPKLPRPYATTDKPWELCNEFSGTEARNCSTFAGISYVSKHIGDFKSSFKVCTQLNDPVNRKWCVHRLAKIYMPSFFSPDINQMINTCYETEASLQGVCLNGLSEGLGLGSAGEDFREYNLCSQVKKELQENCLSDPEVKAS